jgi:hypothetical protein
MTPIALKSNSKQRFLYPSTLQENIFNSGTSSGYSDPSIADFCLWLELTQFFKILILIKFIIVNSSNWPSFLSEANLKDLGSNQQFFKTP